MDEREKLRRFRELDDAFAAALRELDSPDTAPDIPTGPPVRSLEEQETDRVDSEESRQRAFERRLRDLMHDYALPEASVSDLLQTLQALGRLA
ncbi:hypothetical protein [Halomonas getboli]|uniref:hypothetical protein n=1 Tax=Halomonas getboli TaxID=2935862 RepID=UPI001FFE40C5|nr:hypothetical protein [Halomonas getboli]MCK2182952.1 hypothetical protein [Halomonas getboli]